MDEYGCCCESGLCDHEGLCDRPIQGFVKMAYVEDCCATCAANMAVTGGAQYLIAAEDWAARQ